MDSRDEAIDLAVMELIEKDKEINGNIFNAEQIAREALATNTQNVVYSDCLCIKEDV